MRKCLFIALFFILLTPAVILFAWREIDSGKEAIYVTEEVLSGDPSAAEGVTLEIASHWDRRLLWDTSYTVGSGQAVQVSFRFSPQQANWPYLMDKKACLSLYYGDSFTMRSQGSAPGASGEIVQESGSSGSGIQAILPSYAYEKITWELEDEWRQTGDIQADEIRIGDYYAYYPLTLNIENTSVFYENVFSNNFYSEYLTDFFHISTGEDRMKLTLERNGAGELISVTGQKSPENARDLWIPATGACAFAADGFYYSYTLENLAEEMIDRGQEKGIFFFPYRREGDAIHIDVEQVRKVQEQPEGWNPVQMLLDEEGGYLYLVSVGEEGYGLFVYEAEGENLALIQQISLLEREADAEGEAVLPYFRQMTAQEGGMLITWSGNNFVFIAGEGGGCRKWCSGVFPGYVPLTEIIGLEFEDEASAQEYREYVEGVQEVFPVDNVCAFDGERLVLAAFEERKSLNVLLAVYDESGQRYSGLYRHSSELDADTDSYGQKRILSQLNRSWPVFGSGGHPVDNPLKIRMEK